MSMGLFFSLLIILGIVFLIIGQFNAKAFNNKEEFFLGKRDLGLFSLTMTFFAAQIGGGALLGTAEEAYRYGWLAMAYPAGLVLGMLILAAGFGSKLRAFNLVTVSQVLEKVYGSKKMRLFSSLLFICALFFILVAQGLAARKFFASLGFENPIFFLVFWSVMISYTAMGGLKAVVSTDIVQGFVKCLALLVLWICAMQAGVSELPSPSLLAFDSQAPWFDWLLLPPLFMLIAQDMGQRCFAARSPRCVTQAALISAALFAVVSLIPVYFGVQARRLGVQIPEGNSVFLSAAKALTNPYAAALCACGVLIAIISIANSLLCSISSQVACDFPIFQEGRFAKSTRLAQLTTVLIGILAALVSYSFKGVIALLIFSYEFSVSVLFIPIFAILMGWSLRKNTAWISMGFGASAYALSFAVDLPLPKAVFALLMASVPVILVKLWSLICLVRKPLCLKE